MHPPLRMRPLLTTALCAAGLLIGQSAPAQTLPEDVIIEQVTIPMRDGFKLDAEIYRFADSDSGSGGVKYPVSTLLTIYNLNFHRDKYHRYFLNDGQIYVGVHMRDSSSRKSDDPAFQFGTYENAYQLTRDAYDVAEWISRQPWCDGNIGFKGGSGNAVGGSAAIWADHPNIKAVSISHSSSNFHDYWMFLNGIKRDTFGLVSHRGINTSARVWPRPDTVRPDIAEWRQWIARRARETRVAYFESAGLYDIFQEAAVDNFAALAPHGRAHVHMEPRWHGPAVNRIDGLSGAYNIYTGRPGFASSYSAYLDGSAVSDSSAHHIAVLSPSSSRYVTATRWPIANTPTAFYLHANGTLQPSPPASPDASLSYVYDPKNPAPNVGGNAFLDGYEASLTPLAGGYNYGPLNQNIPALTGRDDILRFVSEPLAAETTVVGNVEADIHVSTTAEDTMFVVKLVAINPDNDFHALLKDGAFLARYHNAAAAGGERLTPGQIVNLQFKLWTTAVTLPAGYRLAVHVTSSAADASQAASRNYLEVHPNTFDPCPDIDSAPVATNTVHLSSAHPSRVSLPVVTLGPSDTTFALPADDPLPAPPYPGALAVRGEGEDFIPNGDTTPSIDKWTDFEEVRKNRLRTRKFILQNTTSADLPLGVLSITGAPEFTLLDPPASVPANGTAILQIRYAPLSSGNHTATVSLAPDSPYAFTFDVTGHCVNYSPVLNASWDPQIVHTASETIVTPPADLFYDPDGDSFTFSVRLAGGGAAPEWVEINPETGVITANAPAGAEGTYELEIVATEAGGGETILVAPVTLTAQPSAFPGTTYDYSDSPTTTRATKIYVPGGSAPVRGFLFNGNGAGGNATNEANDRHKQAWADKHRFAIVATGNFGRFQGGFEGDDWRVFAAALADAATRSGHPELVNAPFVGWGYSNGGQMTYGLARLLPDRAIAFITNKGGYYETGIGSDPLGVPAIWFAGQNDNENNRRATIETLYKAGRAAGAPWAWVEERNEGHNPGNSESLSFPFFDEVIALRYPADPANVPTVSSPPVLLAVDQDVGWLVDQEHASWSTGYLQIRPAGGFAGDPLLKGWLPSERAARLYRALASYDNSVPWDFGANTRKPVFATLPYVPHNPNSNSSWQAVFHPDCAAFPPIYEVRIAPSHTNWTALEIRDGNSLLTTITNNGSFTTPGASYHTVTIPLTMLDSSARLNALHAELILPDETRRTSHVTWLTSDAGRVRPLAPPDLTGDQVTPGGSTVATDITFSWGIPANAPVAEYGVILDNATEILLSTTSFPANNLSIGPHEIKVRARGTNENWGPYATMTFNVLNPVQAPDSLSANATSETSAELVWDDSAPAETGYEIQRRSMDLSSVVVLDYGDAGYVPTGNWTSSNVGVGFFGDSFLHDGSGAKGALEVTASPGLTGSHEISLWIVPSQDGDNRVPLEVHHAGGITTLTLNQSNIAPTNEWDFRDANNGVNIQHASVVNSGSQFDPTASHARWSYSAAINSSVTTGGNLRLRASAGTGASSFSGYVNSTTNLGYTSGVWILEVDLAGWNVVGTANDQWFQLGFMNDNGSTISCGLVLQQNASGLAFWGRALGTGGTNIGSVTTPVKQYPASQLSAVTLRLVADFSNNTYRVFYRDSDTNGAFVEAASTGAIDSARKGRALRLQLVQDWSQSGEYIDLTRIRTYQPAAPSTEGSWHVLGTFTLAANSFVSINNSGTLGLVRADAFRFTPPGAGVWATLTTLPANTTSYEDTGLSPGGTYEYRVRAVAGEVVGEWSPTATVALSGGDSYLDWVNSIEWNGADSSPDADANGDGLVNFLTFALGGNPVIPGSTSFPYAELTFDAEDRRQIEFTFQRARADLTYQVQTSETLATDSWQTRLVNPGQPGEEITVAIPLEENERLFVRLRVTLD